MVKWTKFKDVKNEWMKDPDFEMAYRELEAEHEVALSLIKARMESGLTQGEVASRMHTSQSVIARLESGKTLPSLKTLYNYAKATGKHLHLHFD